MLFTRALGIALACVFLFPLSALASDQIPAEVEQAIRQDLNRFKNSLVAHGEFHLNSENAKEVILGEGMKQYIVETRCPMDLSSKQMRFSTLLVTSFPLAAMV